MDSNINSAEQHKIDFDIPSDQKPQVINYQINDICNARCVMCNVWRRQRGLELSQNEFRSLFSKKFFSEVRHLGITGGEPTLSSNLNQFYQIALEVLPNLQGGHFITNGLNLTKALEIYTRVATAYAEHGVSFGGMVSIDGVGTTHDIVRGRQNAFERSQRTLFALRDAGIQVIACCTIVKDNVYALNDLLDWSRLNGIELRFRIADFINRLYVDETNPQIRAFEPSEIKHLVAFFHHLIHFHETKDEIRRTYESILSLLTGGERLTGCPYHSMQAINIDCEGRFTHCAPHGVSHLLGDRPALEVMRLEPQRHNLIERHCPHCIHDYHADWTPSEVVRRSCDALAHQRLYGQPIIAEEIVEVDEIVPNHCALSHILLVGWYGTETAGDIAILAGVVAKYANKHPKARFTLLSLFPYYTSVTINDLPLNLALRVTVFDYSSLNAELATEEADAVVMAGGPLMDIPQTSLIASLFYKFKIRGKLRIIEGCGIGPLNIDKYRNHVIAIVKMATQISVRDQDSATRLRQWGITKPIAVEADPAIGYIKNLGVHWKKSNSNVICCFFRELTSEYPQITTPREAETKITNFLRLLLESYPLARVELHAMHYFPIGNDDRLFARKIASNLATQRVIVPLAPLSPVELIERMSSSAFCVTMRFHSVVFAHTIDAPFIAIDYTAGGKIAGFLRDVGEGSRCFNFEGLESISPEIIKKLASTQVQAAVQ